MWSQLFIFTFISLAWGDLFRKILLRPVCRRLLPLFYWKSFMVSGLTSRSLIQLKFVVVYGEKAVQFHALARSGSVFPTTFLEETVFFPLHVLASFVTDDLTRIMGSFLDFPFCSIDLCICFCVSTILICFCVSTILYKIFSLTRDSKVIACLLLFAHGALESFIRSFLQEIVIENCAPGIGQHPGDV